MKPQTYETKILEVIEETPTTRTLAIEVPDDFSFQAGQFVMVLFIQDGKEVRRAYSISSSPNQIGSIEITVKLVPNSNGASKMLHELKKDDLIKIIAPFGIFIAGDEEHSVLIGAASGIAPLRSMWRYRLENELGSTSIFMTAKTTDDLIFFNEAMGLAEDEESISTYATVTRDPEFEGNKGRLTLKTLKENSINYDVSTFYVCGSPQFCDCIKQLLLEDNIPIESIRMEKY